MTKPPYFEHAVIVPGHVAVIYRRVLDSPKVRDVLDALADPDEIAVRVALRTAAKSCEQAQFADELQEQAKQANCLHDPIETGEAAGLLGVSRRWIQRLAARGAGHKAADGRWWLERQEVERMARERAA